MKTEYHTDYRIVIGRLDDELRALQKSDSSDVAVWYGIYTGLRQICSDLRNILHADTRPLHEIASCLIIWGTMTTALGFYEEANDMATAYRCLGQAATAGIAICGLLMHRDAADRLNERMRGER